MKVLPPALASILIAEDDALIAELVSLHLEKAGYRVAWAKNGGDALRRIGEARPDLMLLDLGLPLVDGFGVLAEIHRRRTVSQFPVRPFPVIVLTARHTADDVTRAVTLGASDFVAKPFEMPTLMSRVSAQLGLS